MTHAEEAAQLWDRWRANCLARNQATAKELERLIEERNQIRQRLVELKELPPLTSERPYSEAQRQAIARGQYRRREREKARK